MIPGNWPGASGHAAKAGCSPYLVTTRTVFSIIAVLQRACRKASRSRVQQLARAGDEHVVDPDVFHEILAHPLAGAAYARAGTRDGADDVAVIRHARMPERLREVQHA